MASEYTTRRVPIDGIELHCAERGAGTPIVFIHGAIDDYRYWTPFLNQPGYRTVSYSRRYNFPNPPSRYLSSYSALVDAEDLGRLSSALGIMSMHIVGLSYGAYVALFFALKNPKSVKSMVLCEAAILSWLPRLPGGAELYKEFLDGLWKPFRRAVSEGDEEGAVSRVAEFFYGKPPSELPRQMVEDLRCNLTEWKVLTASTDPFPEMNSSLVRDLKIPTLMLSGQESLRLHKLIDQELQRQLQNVKRQIIPKASHDMWRDNPAVCEKAMRSFLVGLEGGGR